LIPDNYDSSSDSELERLQIEAEKGNPVIIYLENLETQVLEAKQLSESFVDQIGRIISMKIDYKQKEHTRINEDYDSDVNVEEFSPEKTFILKIMDELEHLSNIIILFYNKWNSITNWIDLRQLFIKSNKLYYTLSNIRVKLLTALDKLYELDNKIDQTKIMIRTILQAIQESMEEAKQEIRIRPRTLNDYDEDDAVEEIEKLIELFEEIKFVKEFDSVAEEIKQLVVKQKEKDNKKSVLCSLTQCFTLKQ